MVLWSDSTKTVAPPVLTDQEIVTGVVMQLNQPASTLSAKPRFAGPLDLFEYETTRG